MLHIDEALRLMREAARDIGVAPLARRVGLSRATLDKLVKGDTKITAALRELEKIGQEHMDEMRRRIEQNAA